MTLPSGYKEGIVRVSNILEFISPFTGTENEKRYLEWLAKNKIDQKEYLEASQELGTFVHNSIEDYINKGEIDIRPSIYTECYSEIEHGINFVDTIYGVETEVYIKEKDNRFQGSCDLIYEDDNGNKVLADWKTWGINKQRFIDVKTGKPLVNKFVVPADKKKKVQIQLSFYAYGLRQNGVLIDKIQLLYLHKEGLKVVDLDILSDEVIENYLDLYEAKQQNKEINFNIITLETMSNKDIRVPLKIHLQTAPIPFADIHIELNTRDLDSGITVKEAINEAVRVQKILHNNYIQRNSNGSYEVTEK